MPFPVVAAPAAPTLLTVSAFPAVLPTPSTISVTFNAAFPDAACVVQGVEKELARHSINHSMIASSAAASPHSPCAASTVDLHNRESDRRSNEMPHDSAIDAVYSTFTRIKVV